MKKRIRLTEGMLHRMIKEAINEYGGWSQRTQQEREEKSKHIISREKSKTEDIEFVQNGEYLWNIMTKQGELLSPNMWFSNLGNDFSEGFLEVCVKNKWNYISLNGQFLSSDWFDNTDPFRNGFGVVENGGKYNYLDKNGRLLSRDWFDYAWPFRPNGYALVEIMGVKKWIDTNCKIYDRQMC